MPAEPTADVEDVLAGLDDRLRELRGRLETMSRNVAELDGASPPASPIADQQSDVYVSLAPRPGTGVDPVDKRAARLLYERLCRRLRILPISLSDGVLTLAAADPDDRFAQNVAHALTGRPLEVVAAIPDEIDPAIDRAFAEAIPDEIDPAIDRAFAEPGEPEAPAGEPAGDREPVSSPEEPADHPEEPAGRPEEPTGPVVSRAHWAVGIVIALIVAAGVVVAPLETAIAVVTTCVVVRTLLALYEFRLRYRSR